MAEFGKIYDIKKFRNEGDGIYAFKPQPNRSLSFFTYESKLMVTNGFKKRTDKMPENEKKLALRLREDYFERNHGGKK
jgi:phage-related protein